jgi:predicted neutral ceramidase superfamily lipid hydrolase
VAEALEEDYVDCSKKNEEMEETLVKSVKEAVKTFIVVIVVFTVTNQLQTISYMCKNRDPPLLDG